MGNFLENSNVDKFKDCPTEVKHVYIYIFIYLSIHSITYQKILICDADIITLFVLPVEKAGI